MRQLLDRRRPAPPRRPRQMLVLGALCAAGALACGEEVLVGRWVLRSTPVDAGAAGDAGALANPQSFNAQRAREHERNRGTNKPLPHDADKRH